MSNDQQSPHGDMTGEVSPDTSSDGRGTDDNVPVSHFDIEDKPSYDPDLYLQEFSQSTIPDSHNSLENSVVETGQLIRYIHVR